MEEEPLQAPEVDLPCSDSNSFGIEKPSLYKDDEIANDILIGYGNAVGYTDSGELSCITDVPPEICGRKDCEICEREDCMHSDLSGEPCEVFLEYASRYMNWAVSGYLVRESSRSEYDISSCEVTCEELYETAVEQGVVQEHGAASTTSEVAETRHILYDPGDGDSKARVRRLCSESQATSEPSDIF